MDSEFREVDTRERGLLEKLLEAATEGRDELRTQLSDVRAKQIEDDGTLILQCRGGIGAPGKYAPVADGIYKDADGADVGLILHLDKGGFMRMLEIIRYDGSRIVNPPSASDIGLLMPESPGEKPPKGAADAD
jgi:uncharacterized protein DUF6984